MTASVGTYANILPTGLSALTIEGITGNPTGYNVYDGNGVLVASSATWPSLTTITKSEDQTAVHAMGSTSTATAATLTPAALNTGDVLIVTLSAGQNLVGSYVTNPFVSGGGTLANPITWSSTTPGAVGIWYGTYTGPNVTTGITPISMYGPSSTSYTENNYWTMSRWAGVASLGAVDTYNAGPASASSPWGLSVSPNGAGELVIEVLAGQTTGYSFTSGSSTFTDLPSATASYASSGGFAVGYKLQTTPTPLTSANGWTSTATGYAYLYGATITLVPATGGSTLSIPAPSGTWKPGYYFVDFVTGTYGSNGYSVDSVQVTVMRDLGNLPSPLSLPSPTADPSIGTPNAEGEDLYLHGWLAHGPERYAITNTTNPTVDAPAVGGLGRTIAGIQTGLTAEKGTNLYFSSGQADSARPRHAFVHFPNDLPPPRYDTLSGMSNSSVNFSDTTLTSGDATKLITGINIPSGTTIATAISGSGTLSATATGTASGLYGIGGNCTLSAYQAGITSVVNAIGPGTTYGVTYFEGLNEPDNSGLSDAATGVLYKNARDAARAASTSVVWLGPDIVCSAPTGSAFGPTIADVQNVITSINSVSSTLDGVSTHNYNMFGGDFLVTDAAIGGMRTMLASNGLGSIPFWETEMGNIIKNFWNGSSAVYLTDRRQAAWTAQTYLTCERHGVPKEQIVYFYDSFQGGQEVYTCIKSTDKSLGPQATFFRVYSEELWGKSWNSSLSFGTIGDALYRADLFTGSAGNLLTLYAQGMVSETVTLASVGTSAVTYSDWLGNTTTVTPVSGSITLTIGDTPIYVRLPAGTTPSISSVGGGIGSATNLASTATAKAGSNPASLTTHTSLNNGTFETGGYLSGPDYMYQSTTTFPQYVELDWSTAQNLNHVLVRQAPPYMDWPSNSAPACAMLTGKLEYWNSATSAWVGVPTVSGNHWDTAGNYNNTTANDFLTTLGHDNMGTAGGMIFSQWDQNWVLNIPFSSTILTTKVRLTVSTASRANFVNSAVNSWSGLGSVVNISEVMAFDLSGTPAPLVGTASTTVNIGDTGSGVAIVAGTAAASIALGTAATGVNVGLPAVGSVTVTMNPASVGQKVTSGIGTGSGSVALSGTGAGIAKVRGVNTGTSVMFDSILMFDSAGTFDSTGGSSITLAGTGAGVQVATGTGTAALTISSSSTVHALSVGTTSTAVTVSSTGSGVAIVQGTTSTPISFSSTGIGAGAPSKIGTASLALSGTATGIAIMTGNATGNVTVYQSGYGTPTYLGTGTAAVSASGTAPGVAIVAGTGTASIAVNPASSGVAKLAGTGSAAIGIASSATTSTAQSGTSTTSVALSGAGVGVMNFTGTASMQLSGVASGVAVLTGTGSRAITLQGAATGIAVLNGVSTVPVNLTATAAGHGITFSTALGHITLTTSATGTINYNGTANVTITGTGVGVSVVDDSGAVSITTRETLSLSLTPLDRFKNPESTDPIVRATVTTDPTILTYTQTGLEFTFTPTGVLGTTTVTVTAYGKSGASVTKTNSVTVIP